MARRESSLSSAHNALVDDSEDAAPWRAQRRVSERSSVSEPRQLAASSSNLTSDLLDFQSASALSTPGSRPELNVVETGAGQGQARSIATRLVVQHGADIPFRINTARDGVDASGEAVAQTPPLLRPAVSLRALAAAGATAPMGSAAGPQSPGGKRASLKGLAAPVVPDVQQQQLSEPAAGFSLPVAGATAAAATASPRIAVAAGPPTLTTPTPPRLCLSGGGAVAAPASAACMRSVWMRMAAGGAAQADLRRVLLPPVAASTIMAPPLDPAADALLMVVASAPVLSASSSTSPVTAVGSSPASPAAVTARAATVQLQRSGAAAEAQRMARHLQSQQHAAAFDAAAASASVRAAAGRPFVGLLVATASSSSSFQARLFDVCRCWQQSTQTVSDKLLAAEVPAAVAGDVRPLLTARLLWEPSPPIARAVPASTPRQSRGASESAASPPPPPPSHVGVVTLGEGGGDEDEPMALSAAAAVVADVVLADARTGLGGTADVVYLLTDPAPVAPGQDGAAVVVSSRGPSPAVPFPSPTLPLSACPRNTTPQQRPSQVDIRPASASASKVAPSASSSQKAARHHTEGDAALHVCGGAGYGSEEDNEDDAAAGEEGPGIGDGRRLVGHSRALARAHTSATAASARASLHHALEGSAGSSPAASGGYQGPARGPAATAAAVAAIAKLTPLHQAAGTGEHSKYHRGRRARIIGLSVLTVARFWSFLRKPKGDGSDPPSDTHPPPPHSGSALSMDRRSSPAVSPAGSAAGRPGSGSTSGRPGSAAGRQGSNAGGSKFAGPSSSRNSAYSPVHLATESATGRPGSGHASAAAAASGGSPPTSRISRTGGVVVPCTGEGAAADHPSSGQWRQGCLGSLRLVADRGHNRRELAASLVLPSHAQPYTGRTVTPTAAIAMASGAAVAKSHIAGSRRRRWDMHEGLALQPVAACSSPSHGGDDDEAPRAPTLEVRRLYLPSLLPTSATVARGTGDALKCGGHEAQDEEVAVFWVVVRAPATVLQGLFAASAWLLNPL